MTSFVSSTFWGSRSSRPLRCIRDPFLQRNVTKSKRARSSSIFASAFPDFTSSNANGEGTEKEEEVELPAETLAAATAAVEKEMPEVVASGEVTEEKGGLESAVGAVPNTKGKEGAVWIDSVVGARGSAVSRPELEAWRKQAMQHLDGLPLPSRKEEAWRFTDMRSLYRMRFKTAATEAPVDVSNWIPQEAGARLVFVDGRFRKEMSSGTEDLLRAGGYAGGLQEYDGQMSSIDNAFASGETSVKYGLYPALNMALARDVAVLRLPDNYVEDKPICFIFASTGGSSSDAAAVSAARLAIIAGENSQATILESFVGVGGEDYPFFFSSACTGIITERGANIQHFAVNETGAEGHHVAQLHAAVKRDSTYKYRTVAVSGSVSRTTCGIDLDETGAHGSINGLTVVNKKRIGDLHSRISHKTPTATSSQLQKNIASERGRAIFNGRILVDRAASGTNSSQLCNSLLLSNKARIDAMPVLEISNQDVQCSHGATVSDLEEEQMFYLRSRGISVNDGRSLLMKSFALEALEGNPFSIIEERVLQIVQEIAPSVVSRAIEHARFLSI